MCSLQCHLVFGVHVALGGVHSRVWVWLQQAGESGKGVRPSAYEEQLEHVCLLWMREEAVCWCWCWSRV